LFVAVAVAVVFMFMFMSQAIIASELEVFALAKEILVRNVVMRCWDEEEDVGKC